MKRDFVDAICLTAPTACGKTAWSLRLAERFPIEVVSMDSAMVYRGMDIGTAKPAPAEIGDVRHHLIDILDPSEPYSAGKFVADAVQTVEGIRRRGNIPLICGGTMLYLKALTGGLADLPRANQEIRASLDAEAARFGWPRLHSRLADNDPEAAARIAPNDSQRIQRALEVFLLTGKPLSMLQTVSTAPALSLLSIALLPGDRRLLAERIAERFDQMLEAGFVDEVATLRAREDLTLATPSMRAVGYRQIWRYLDGEYDRATAREKAIVATRQLAKRQLTWLRSGLPDIELTVGHEPDFDRLVECIESETFRWT